MKKIVNKFELLRAKNIIEILDGDKNFGDIETKISQKKISISMPYLSGPALCELSNQFGYPITYNYGSGTKSRWVYMDELLEYCISKNTVSNLLNVLFDKSQFVGELRGCLVEEIDSVYHEIINRIIDQINGILYFGGNELVKLGDQFYVKEIGKKVVVDVPKVKTIDRTYITSISDRAMQDIMTGNYDSAITKSRTLLEEVFCYVIEKKGETPSDSGDIGKLYNQVKSLYNMHQNKDMDKRINSLLSGLEKILTAIADMRNKGSDSHGVGNKRINIAEHHARLFVNCAMTMADFVLSIGDNNK